MSSSSQSQPVLASKDAIGETEPTGTVFECVISAEIIRRAMLVRTGDETRYYLSGVHVSPHPDGGAYVVGTDGSVLAIFHDNKAHITGSAIVAPDEILIERLATERGDPRERLLVGRKDRLYVTDGARKDALAVFEKPGGSVIAAQYRRATIDGKYPDWRRVFLPLDPAGVVPALDARLLSKLSKALCLERRRKIALRPTGSTSETPVWVFGDFPRSVGVIMGLRGHDSHGAAVPAWLGEIKKPSEPEAADTSGANDPPRDAKP